MSGVAEEPGREAAEIPLGAGVRAGPEDDPQPAPWAVLMKAARSFRPEKSHCPGSGSRAFQKTYVQTVFSPTARTLTSRSSQYSRGMRWKWISPAMIRNGLSLRTNSLPLNRKLGARAADAAMARVRTVRRTDAALFIALSRSRSFLAPRDSSISPLNTDAGGGTVIASKQARFGYFPETRLPHNKHREPGRDLVPQVRHAIVRSRALTFPRRPITLLPMSGRLFIARRMFGFLLGASAALLLAVPALHPQETDPVRRAYPERISPDLSFDDVISSQPFPPVKYPVPVIGWKDHPEEIHVAPNGALVFPARVLPGGLYLLPRLRTGDVAVPEFLDANAVTQELVDGYLPGVRSSWKVRGVAVRELAFAMLLENPTVRTGRETLVTVVRWTLKNGSGRLEDVRLSFFVGQAVSGLSLFKAPPPYPGTLVFKSPFIVGTGGRILLRVSAPGSAVALTPAAAGSGADEPAPKEITAAFRLKPGEERTVDLFIPYFPIVIEKSGEMERLAVVPQLELFRDFWTRELNREAQFIVPEKRVRDSYRASLAYNMILVDRDPKGFTESHPDATAYEHVWAGDSACIIHAADRLGYHEDAAAYLDYFLSRQGATGARRRGFFRRRLLFRGRARPALDGRERLHSLGPRRALQAHRRQASG